MLIYDICVRKDYEKNGEKKVKWFKVGVFKIADSGKKYISLFLHPHTEFFVFDHTEEKLDAIQEEN